MTKTDQTARRNARHAKQAIRDLYIPKPQADGPGYQSSRERRRAIRWVFPTETEE